MERGRGDQGVCPKAFSSFPSPTPSFSFCSTHFSRGKNAENLFFIYFKETLATQATHHEKFVQSSRISSHMCRSCASNFRRTDYFSEYTGNWWYPLTWRIETMLLAEPSRTMAYTPRKTVYRLARGQPHFKKAKLWRPTFPYLDQYRSRVWPVNHLYHQQV